MSTELYGPEPDWIQVKREVHNGRVFYSVKPAEYITERTETWILDVSRDEATTITAGTIKYRMFVPYDFVVTDTIASLGTVSSSGTVDIDINTGVLPITSLFSTVLTIDASELSSHTASTPYVFSSTTPNLTKGHQLTVDIDSAGTGAAGLKVYIVGYQQLP